MQAKAILFDTRSIQGYIFSSNKLKMNIGASYMVEQLFSDILIDKVLNEELGYDIDKTAWKTSKDIMMRTEPDLRCEVAYIGGGNALLLFNMAFSDDAVRQVVQRFSARLLTEAPGLRTGAAIGLLELEDADFAKSLAALYSKLKENQNIFTAQVNVPYTGLTVPCSYTGGTAQLVYQEPATQEKRFISAEAAAKLAMNKDANKALQQRFAKELGDKYEFPQELEELGQIETENYIAVVHIDGNNMGAKFRECTGLQARKELSLKVSKASVAAFSELLTSLIDEYDMYKQSPYFRLGKNGKNYLPIRPLILGGDDVAFVCTGRLAVEFAKRYMEYMIKQGIECCGGIAIQPTSYPFFRGYELAEQLCGAAKVKSRKVGRSWLDFAIQHGEQPPELAQLRAREYSGRLGNLHFGPYKVNDAKHRYSIDKLLAGTAALQDLPRNKVKEMRNVLAKDEHAIQRFLEQLDRQNIKLPIIEGWADYNDALWYGEGKHELRTPYTDMIEMMDFTFVR